MQTKINLLNY